MAGFWFDFLRGLKKKPFWNTETQTGVECGGFCWANYETGGLLSCQLLDAYCIWRCGESILALASSMGGARVDAWICIICSWETAAYVWRNQTDSSRIRKRPWIFLNGTEVQTEIAMHFTSLNWNLLPVNHG